MSVDALEELAIETRDKFFLFRLQVTPLHFLQGILSLFDVRTVSVVIQVGLISISRIRILSHIPVDGINLVDGFLLMNAVRIFLQISLQRIFRTAYHGIGPVLIRLLQTVKMGCNRIAVGFVCVLVGVQITLQNHRVSTLHGVFVSFHLLVLVGIVIEVIQDSADENREDERDDQNASGSLLLFWFLVFRILLASVSVGCRWAYWWRWRSCRHSRICRSCRHFCSSRSCWLLHGLSCWLLNWSNRFHWLCRLHRCRRSRRDSASATYQCRIGSLAVRTHFKIIEIYLSAVRAFGDFARNLYTAAWTCWCFIANLASTFRTFYNCHSFI